MKRKLIETGAADGRVREIPITDDEFLIGRGEDCNLCLHDPEVSRHHSMIRRRGDESVASDLGSSNGTYVNGNRLLSQVKLKTGDELVVGPFRYVIDLGDDPDFRIPQAVDDQFLTTQTLKEMRNRPTMK